MIDYLSHHGVKGMRWGVRKDKDKAHRQGAMAGYVKVAQRIQDVAWDINESQKNLKAFR